MNKLYFHINGSSSPFWKKELVRNDGTYFYNELYWPTNFGEDSEECWKEINTLYSTYSNPIDKRFPSLWEKNMCLLFNKKVIDFFNKSKVNIHDFDLVNRFKPIQVDSRLHEYKTDPIKSHLSYNVSFGNQKEFQQYLEDHPETKSKLISNLSVYKPFQISQHAYDAFRSVFITFGEYKNFPISFCPFSNQTYLTIINLGGHGATYEAMRINREDIFSDPAKLLNYVETYFQAVK